jgi:hypothetical protein
VVVNQRSQDANILGFTESKSEHCCPLALLTIAREKFGQEIGSLNLIEDSERRCKVRRWPHHINVISEYRARRRLGRWCVGDRSADFLQVWSQVRRYSLQ